MIKYIFYFLLILGFIFCSDPSGNKGLDPPLPLKMVEKTVQSDTTLNESGIDAIPEGDMISVVWHPYQGLNRIKKFKIFRSSEPAGDKNYNLYDEINIENNFDQDTTYVDNNVNLETMYHYFVTVVDEDNQESFPSDTAKYFLIEKAEVSNLTLPFNPGEIINFEFNIPTSANSGGFILRIERSIGLNTKELVYIEYVQNFFNTGTILKEISTNSFRSLLQSVDYRWRIDLVAGDIRSEGSESNWANFTIDWGN